MTPLVLSVLALLLAGPAPWLLARLPQLRGAPRAALVLWQSVALAAVLAALGAGLSLATMAVSGDRAHLGLLVASVALAVTVVVLGRLLLSGHVVGTRLRGWRRRHREMVDLLAEERTGVRVLEHAQPTAYCVPGLARSRVVVSSAALDRLGPAELEAVLAHEHAHLRARHDLVLEGFTVLHEAFPAVVTSRGALDEVRLLVEVLADRAAIRASGAPALLRALSALLDSSTPRAALGASGTGVAVRVGLLMDERPRPLLATVAYVTALAVLALPTLLVVLPWLDALALF